MTTPARPGKKDSLKGYLPEIYKDFVKGYPDISQAYDALADKCYRAGPLDKKTGRLIKLGIAVGINSEGDVRSHARKALEEGLSPEEIRQVVLLALTDVGFPHMIAALKWVEEVLAKTK
jgi:4-carboxymuconolactone decarboxylase